MPTCKQTKQTKIIFLQIRVRLKPLAPLPICVHAKYNSYMQNFAGWCFKNCSSLYKQQVGLTANIIFSLRKKIRVSYMCTVQLKLRAIAPPFTRMFL